MLSGSFISIIFVLVEFSLALGAIIYFIQKKLKASRKESKILTQILEEERSPKKFREKLKDYFEQEIKRTVAKYEEFLQSGEKKKHDLLLARKSALDVERKASQKNPLDLDYWSSVEAGYSVVFPKPEKEPSPPSSSNIPAAVSETDSNRQNLSISTLNTASREELGRLRSVINNQYSTIDELKLQLRKLGDHDLAADHPAIRELQKRIEGLSNDQNQMAMCVKILEAENERLLQAVSQLDHADAVFAALQGSEQESPALQSLAQELQQAEAMIRDLLRTNKEQLQCIATLESELELFQQSNSAASSEIAVSLQQAKQEIKQLNQDKLQHMATIERLQSERQQWQDANSERATDYLAEYKTLEKQLHAKVAELDLLREEYLSMHEKYIKLYQDKAS